MILGMLGYFKIAVTYGIIDKPNQRSSHAIPTIRGGGIVFFIAIVFWSLCTGFQYPFFTIGALLIAIISFIDDVKGVSALMRFSVQTAAFLLMGSEVHLFALSALAAIGIIIVGIGTLNAFNFMDGINGITGVYALVNLCTFLYLSTSIDFVQEEFVIVMILGVLIFLFFNFRKKARCFAGDVGSVTLAFVQTFLLLRLIFATQQYGWILLFLLFGVDSVVTIIYRLRKRENIFQPHRSHLYQYISNELRWPHRLVATLYGAIQLLINCMLIGYIKVWSPVAMVLVAVSIGVVYVILREMVLNKIAIKGIFR